MLKKLFKRGFTLVETVVTLGIVATLAAVVVPEVVKQFDTSEPARVQQDLKNLQVAIQTFNVNVKVLPGDIADLTTQITADAGGLPSPDTSLTSTGDIESYSAAQAGFWKGPYIDVPFVENATEVTRETGKGAVIHDDFVCYNMTDAPNTAGVADMSASGQACPAPTAGDKLFLAIRVTGLGDATDARFIAVNDLIDGTSATETANRGTLGRIRVLGTTTYFLVTPIN